MFGKIWCQPKYLVLYPKDLGMEHNEIVDRVYYSVGMSTVPYSWANVKVDFLYIHEHIECCISFYSSS